ncbi:DUF3048 domain-containing protein [Haloimpatiens sp. FM7315]|uniref:DUF3048 domain-containing protein n=1 Tax=Haloimpatiens sp. FM7315 TaxID=3298609 RepID=UPI00370B223E
MKKKIFLIILLICSLTLTEGCDLFFRNQKNNSQIKIKEDIKNNSSKENFLKYTSEFTGELISYEDFKKTPFMVIIENSKPSRPQHGLNYADIVYETYAEGGIPRFIALFQKNSCKKIGPVRSARNYFIDIANEYNMSFAHCGGSEEALNRIKNNKEKSINEIPNPKIFFRDKTRKPPHNLYVSSNDLVNYIKSHNFNKPLNSTLKFDSDYWKNSNLPKATDVSLAPNNFYKTSYNLEKNKYVKTMDSTKSKDALDNSPLSADNIVIQLTDIVLQNDGLHLNIKLVGEGKGYVISNGKYKKIKWRKESKNSPTILLDEEGKIVPLSPGKTWWHILKNSCKVFIK